MTRKEAREAMAALLATINTFAATYDREPPDFGGLSPVGMVQSNGTRPGPARTLGVYQREHELIISLWWRWGSATEDEMDTLSDAVWDLIESNSGPTATWGSIEADEGFSQMGYPLVDGIQYRVEAIRVKVW